MNASEANSQISCHGQAQTAEAPPYRLHQEIKKPKVGLARRVLLFFVKIVSALGKRLGDWYTSTGSQGYLPNLHLE